MKTFLPIIQEWRTAGKKIVIARVIKTWNASPRPVGSILLISEDMEMAGSVSGGCVEGAVLKASKQSFETGQSQLLDFGVSNDEAWTVGLSCGGRIQVLVQVLPEQNAAIWEVILQSLEQNTGGVWISSLQDVGQAAAWVNADGTTLNETNKALKEQALLAYNERKSKVVELEGQSYFLHVLAQKSQLFLIGAAHITADLIQLAHSFQFESIVIDPRGIFANKTQFEEAPDQLFNDYPSEVLSDFKLDHYTYAVVLSHDPKIDDNALHVLLKQPVAYIGALGSKRTHAKRVNRLLEAGISQAEVDRIHGPVGVDINAKTPREIALSIMAEIIAAKNQFM